MPVAEFHASGIETSTGSSTGILKTVSGPMHVWCEVTANDTPTSISMILQLQNPGEDGWRTFPFTWHRNNSGTYDETRADTIFSATTGTDVSQAYFEYVPPVLMRVGWTISGTSFTFSVVGVY